MMVGLQGSGKTTTVPNFEAIPEDKREAARKAYDEYVEANKAMRKALDDLHNYRQHKESSNFQECLHEDVEEETVTCGWCGEEIPESDCRYEVDFGWLCPQCEAALKSRGEELTFKE